MEIKKIEKSNFVMFPRMQHRGLQFSCVMWRGKVTTGSYTNSQSRTLWPTSNYQRQRQNLTISLVGVWARTIGVSTSRVTSPSSASSQASARPYGTLAKARMQKS